MAGYLGELCQNFVHLQSGSERHVDVIRDADHLTLDVDRAINVALIAGAAITNALKHAFPDGRRGTIQVGLHRLREDVLRNPRSPSYAKALICNRSALFFRLQASRQNTIILWHQKSGIQGAAQTTISS